MRLNEYIYDKKEILKRVSEEQIFERYLGEEVDLKRTYKNTNRVDKHGGCTFFIRDIDHRLIFHDHGKYQYDCFDFVQEKFRVGFYDTLRIIAYDFGLSDQKIEKKEYISKTVKKNRNSIKIKRKLFSKSDLELWSIGGLVLDHNDLQNSKIYSIEAFWETIGENTNLYNGLRNSFAYHFHGYNYQLYFPLKSKGYRRFINPSGIKWGDLEFLPNTGDHLIITKSKKDSFYLRLFGLNSIFIINEAITISEEVMENLQKRFLLIITLFDNDKTGKIATLRYRERFNTIPFLIPEGEGKDFAEYLSNKGKDYIVEVIEYFKDEFL